MLQPLYGGALARPFTTHHNALDRDLYLRIATELYLKRCIVGGIERVYELGKDFRNEGISLKHNPEFTMLEWYEAYADYDDAAERLEQLVAGVAERGPRDDQGRARRREIDLAPPWRRVTLRDAIRERDRDRRRSSTRPARRSPRRWAPRPSPSEGWGKLVDGLLSKQVEPTLIQPTFVLDYPVEMSPFAKRHRDDERPGRALGGLSSAGSRSPTRSPSSTTPTSSAAASSSRPRSCAAATRRRSRSTRPTSRRSSTGCRRPPASASASTAW